MNNFEERKKRENNYTLYIYVRAKAASYFHYLLSKAMRIIIHIFGI